MFEKKAIFRFNIKYYIYNKFQKMDQKSFTCDLNYS